MNAALKKAQRMVRELYLEHGWPEADLMEFENDGQQDHYDAR